MCGEKFEYRITPAGEKLVKKELSENPSFQKVLDKMEVVKKSFNRQDLRSLLSQIYSKYPEYTSKSRFEF